MSAGLETMDRERGDDRNRDVSIERLEEMFGQPSYDESTARESEDPEFLEPGIGEFAPVEARRNSLHPPQLGRLSLRYAYTRPLQTEIFINN
jgi:hypothetical protein